MARPTLGPQRREQILVAFEACVLRNGIEKTTLEDIAKEAGQPRPLVRHFAGNRDELTSLLIDRMVQRVAKRLAAIHERGKGSTKKFVRAFYDDFYGDELSNRTTVELWAMSLRSPKLQARLSTLYDDILQVFAAEIADSRSSIDAKTAFDITYAVYSLLLGATILSGMGLTPYEPGNVLRVAERLAMGTASPRRKTKVAPSRRKAQEKKT